MWSRKLVYCFGQHGDSGLEQNIEICSAMIGDEIADMNTVPLNSHQEFAPASPGPEGLSMAMRKRRCQS